MPTSKLLTTACITICGLTTLVVSPAPAAAESNIDKQVQNAKVRFYQALINLDGSSITEICPNNHRAGNDCAHFVSHVLRLKGGGLPCGTPERVGDLFKACSTVRSLRDGDVPPDPCLIFVKQKQYSGRPNAGDDQSGQRFYNQGGKAHVGFYVDGMVRHYSNSRHKVVVMSLADFRRVFKSEYKSSSHRVPVAVDFFYGTFGWHWLMPDTLSGRWQCTGNGQIYRVTRGIGKYDFKLERPVDNVGRAGFQSGENVLKMTGPFKVSGGTVFYTQAKYGSGLNTPRWGQGTAVYNGHKIEIQETNPFNGVGVTYTLKPVDTGISIRPNELARRPSTRQTVPQATPPRPDSKEHPWKNKSGWQVRLELASHATKGRHLFALVNPEYPGGHYVFVDPFGQTVVMRIKSRGGLKPYVESEFFAGMTRDPKKDEKHKDGYYARMEYYYGRHPNNGSRVVLKKVITRSQ